MINVPVMCRLSNRLVCVCWVLYGQAAGFRLFSDFEDLVGKNGRFFTTQFENSEKSRSLLVRLIIISKDN